MVEKGIIGSLFIGALYYLWSLFKKQFGPNHSGCASGCTKCAIKLPEDAV